MKVSNKWVTKTVSILILAFFLPVQESHAQLGFFALNGDATDPVIIDDRFENQRFSIGSSGSRVITSGAEQAAVVYSRSLLSSDFGAGDYAFQLYPQGSIIATGTDAHALVLNRLEEKRRKPSPY
ncbi:hypothetical protein CI610_03157 [invertebrate metagenome]|uniref:Uncharacterized protein n=1 Tax=invertebrate metagenome TaxID=1711999 RepID=A0A2H9T3W1_9ZZZZ